MSSIPLFSPRDLKRDSALDDASIDHIIATRQRLRDRLVSGTGPRLVVVGPCSIHSEAAALAYAERLEPLVRRYESDLVIVMRAYLEKPRTTVGWKGFVYDPSLNGDGDLASGLRRSRALLCRLARLRIPLATEILEPLTVPYLEDCFSWAAIGARTTESQVHRQLVSGLSFPVGFKNGTDGNVQVALAAVKAAAEPHTLLGVDADGRVAVTRTQGNRATHVILRGSSAGPNYSESSVTQLLSSVPQPGRLRLLIDCAHGNSGKDPSKQIHAAQAVSAQFSRSDVDILGLMLESHVSGGSQPVSPNASPHTSVTDPCLGFEQTAQILEELAIAAKRATRTAERPSATHGDYPSMRASRIQA